MTQAAQFLLGAVTTLLWILVGIYFIGTGEHLAWQIPGGIALGYGIVRVIGMVLGLVEARKQRGGRPS